MQIRPDPNIIRTHAHAHAHAAIKIASISNRTLFISEIERLYKKKFTEKKSEITKQFTAIKLLIAEKRS